jgi:hypothetical protein
MSLSTPLRRGTMPSVWVLRGVLAAGLVLALVAGIPEGYTPPVLLVGVVVAGALVAAFRPDSLGVSVTMGVVIFWWALQLRSEMPGAVLVSAAGLVVAHVAATLLTYGPVNLQVDPQLALLWAMRGAMTWTAALAVWAVARAYTGHGSPTLFWLAGLAAAVVGAVVAGVAAPLRSEERE